MVGLPYLPGIFSAKTAKLLVRFCASPVPLLCTVVGRLCEMYSRFLFSFPDVKESNGSYFNDSCSPEESGCCIGGVDFVTLVFIFIPQNHFEFTLLWDLWMYLENVER